MYRESNNIFSCTFLYYKVYLCVDLFGGIDTQRNI